MDDGLIEFSTLQHLTHVLNLVASYVADVMADDVVHEMVLFVVGVVVMVMRWAVMNEYLNPIERLLNGIGLEIFLVQSYLIKAIL